MDPGLEPSHYDHLCIDSHKVDSEGECPQEDCIPPKHHHDIGVMSGYVGGLSEASYVLKMTKKDEDEPVQVLPRPARQAGEGLAPA